MYFLQLHDNANIKHNSGIQLDSLNLISESSDEERRDRGFYWLEQWTGQIVENELFLKAKLVIRLDGASIIEKMKHLGHSNYRICWHTMLGSRICMSPTYPGQGVGRRVGWCSFCLTDWTVEEVVDESGHYIVAKSYHRLGSGRSWLAGD